MLVLAIAVAVVVLVSATCSLFEAVLYSVPVSHIEALIEQGRPSGRILKGLRERVEKPITAVLSLNTISNTAGAAVAGALAVDAFGEDNLVFFSAAFTLLILLVAEVVPKTAGVVYSKPLAALVARPLTILTAVFTPIVWLCGFVTRVISGGTQEQAVSSEELRVLARLGRSSGAIDDGEGQVIENVLTLARKQVKEVMTPRTVVFSLSADSTVGDAFRMPELAAHSRFPLFGSDSNRPLGLIYSRDVMAAAAHDEMETKLQDLAKPIRFIGDDHPLDRTLGAFLKQEHHLMAVLGEFGGFIGVITLEDVVEELLGREIVDETDKVKDLRELARKRRDDLLND